MPIASAAARTLSVGPGLQFTAPSLAIKDALDGDTIEVAPGEYFDCAIIAQNHLTIVGTGPGVFITDKTCAGKALFVLDGDDITFRNLTLERARVVDGNGAGIRAEGGSLTIDNVWFLDNQTALLAYPKTTSTIRIIDSVFDQNGRCDGFCIPGIIVGPIALLHIERSKILEARQSHQIRSQALRNELIDDDIEDGFRGSSGFLVDIPNGGALVIQGCTFEKGLFSSNLTAAVMIGDVDRSQPTTELTVRHNSFVNNTGTDTVFIKNWSEAEPRLERNSFQGDEVVETSSAGYWFHWVRHMLYQAKTSVLSLPDLLKRAVHDIRA